MASKTVRLLPRGQLSLQGAAGERVDAKKAADEARAASQPRITPYSSKDIFYPRGGLTAPSRPVSRIVKPFLDVQVEPRQTVIPRPLLPGEDSEAFIIWGKQCSFATPERMDDPNEVDTNSPDYPAGGPGGKTDTPKKQMSANVYVEQRRVTHKKKIYDPEDDENYIEVEVIDLLQMRDVQDGEVITWIFENPE